MAQKPSIPKGTRDFLPADVAKRNYIFNTIKGAFQKYGFQPIETPSFEKRETLLGKYGEEGDRLIFRILNSGDYLSKYTFLLGNHIRFVFKQGLRKKKDEYLNNLVLNNNEKSNFVEELLSPNFIKKIISEFKNDKEIGPIIDYYAPDLFDKIREEFIIFQNSEMINTHLKNSFLNIEREKIENIEWDPTEDKFLSNLIDSICFRTLGRWFSNIQTKYLTPQISDKALRYDLTVPFARFVVQHQNELTFPFKRYQIQPVWRADRPQHGRYQEFFQCDADVVGSDSLLYELEFVQLFDEVLTELGIPDFSIKINNRKILSGIAEVSGEADKLIDITVAIDKLDKIGQEGVEKELREKGVSENAISIIAPLFDLSGSNQENLARMREFLKDSDEGQKGLDEMSFIFDQIAVLGLNKAKLEFDVTLARGLNYYTGAIFEVKANGVNMGSICGGGRYDDLTGLFGMPGMSGVGISFGADRIYDVLAELNLFPAELERGLTLLFVNFGEKEQAYCLPLLKEVRANGIDAELYPSFDAKMKKQMKYADDKRVAFVAIVGESEMAENLIQVKNMTTGEQEEMSLEEMIDFLLKNK